MSALSLNNTSTFLRVLCVFHWIEILMESLELSGTKTMMRGKLYEREVM